MSGSLRLLKAPVPKPLLHDHVDLAFSGGKVLRLNDPRRLGCIRWQPGDATAHPLLAHLGVEPLSGDLTRSLSQGLRQEPQGARSRPSSWTVASSWALATSMAGGIPVFGRRSAFNSGRTGDLKRLRGLAEAIKRVLSQALDAGGTTLRDFVGSDGRPGYFRQKLNVYGRGGRPCRRCGASLQHRRIGGRADGFCRRCQAAR